MLTSPAKGTQTTGGFDPSFFERLFEGAGLAIFACETTGRILIRNELAEALSRRSAAAPVLNAAQLFHGEDAQRFADALKELIATREPLEFRATLDGPNGPSEYAVWLTPRPGDAGALAGMTVWFHDITARMQLRRSMRKTERLSTLGSFSGAIAHHYNNSLACIIASLEFAGQLQTVPMIKKALARSLEAAQRAASLTQQLLAFAQGDYRASDQSDLTEAVLYYFDEHENWLHEHQVELDLEFERIPIVAVPRDHLMVVINNIVLNAVDALPNGGRLSVQLVRHDNDHVRLSIRDNGPGIEPRHMERLFEPFFSTKFDAGSRQAGMGLAVAYGLVQEMGGLLTASSQPSQGSRFDIRLPIRPAIGCAPCASFSPAP